MKKVIRQSLSCMLALILVFITCTSPALASNENEDTGISISRMSAQRVAEEINAIKAIFPEARISVDEYIKSSEELLKKSPEERIKIYQDLREAGPIEEYSKVYADGSYVTVSVYTPFFVESKGVNLGTSSNVGNVTRYVGSQVWVNHLCNMDLVYVRYKVDHYFSNSTYVGSVYNAYSSNGWGNGISVTLGPGIFTQTSGAYATCRFEYSDTAAVGAPASYGYAYIRFTANSFAVETWFQGLY